MDITDLEKLTGKDMAALVKLRKIYKDLQVSQVNYSDKLHNNLTLNFENCRILFV